MTYRQPGQQIEVTFMVGEKPFLIMPVTVVEDGPERIMHYLAAGTTYLRRVAADGSTLPRVIAPDDLSMPGTRLVPGEWGRTNRLIAVKPGRAYGVHLKYDAETREFLGWYVNLQEPLVRTEHGFKTRDAFLDIIVDPHRSWRWKDEDELEEAVSLGRITRAQADAIWTEGERVVQDIEDARWPFDDSLRDWRPEPEWPVPRLSHEER